MNKGAQIYSRFRNRWKTIQYLQPIIVGLAVWFPLGFGGLSWGWTAICSVLVASIYLAVKKPWRISQSEVIQFLDQHITNAEHSSFLLVQPKTALSGIAQLQQQKVTAQLEKEISKVQPPNQWNVLLGSLLLSGILSLLAYRYQPFARQNIQAEPASHSIVFTPVDSLAAAVKIPKILRQSLRISYPDYTNKPSFTSKQMNVKVLEGSKLKLTVAFDTMLSQAQIEFAKRTVDLKFTNKSYSYSWKADKPEVYNLKFKDLAGNKYISEVYTVELETDQPPLIKVTDLKPFNSFAFNETKKLKVNAEISDDYGLDSAYIVATISRGSGESVKFREERLNFDRSLSRGAKNSQVEKLLNLDALQMKPGDELFFYIEAIDGKRPKPNKMRSDTYFAVIKDTLTDSFQVAQTSAVDLMPAYFKSQRQLIIDTENLIAEKDKISNTVFKAKSNELGYDQKALRIKYGAFMGDESDMGATSHGSEENETEKHDHEDDHDDQLDAYTHKHDTENEHHLVDHDHEDEGADDKTEDPLHDYLHNHDNPEESTLFTQSLKTKLRLAMTAMWDSELQLRLYQPQKSLPYQYRALKLLQEIKNSARIYVHRIGFDPPPIKEDKRLSGKLDKVTSSRKVENLGRELCCTYIKKALEMIDFHLENKTKIEAPQKEILENAGNEVAAIALANPGSHLRTLQQIKLLITNNKFERRLCKEVSQGLQNALPEQEPTLLKRAGYYTPMDELVFKSLEANE